MSVQPAGAWMIEVVPKATMFAIITSPLTTPAGTEMVREMQGLPQLTVVLAEEAARNVGALPPEEVATVAVAGFSASRWATATALVLMVTVFWPVAPMLSWIASNIAPCAAPLAEPLDAPPLESHSSVRPAGMLAAEVPKAISAPSAAPNEATSMVFATVVVMPLGVERDETLLVYPMPFCTLIGV